MPVRTFTAEELLETLRNRGGLNDAETEGTQDPDLIDRINEECLETLYNLVLQAHRDYYVVTTLTTLSPSTVRYRIPPRAMYQRVRDIFYRSVDGTRRRPLDLVNRSGLGDYPLTQQAEPAGFYVEGNTIVLVPDIGSSFSGFLEIAYHFRPGELVLSTECRRVTAVDLVAKNVTLASARPAAWTTSSIFDIHSGDSGAEIHGWDLSVSSFPDTTHIIFNQAIDGSVQGRLPVEVGDYVCLAETAALPGLPREMHTLLAQAVNVMLMEGDDPDGYKVSKEQLDKKLLRVMKLIGERMDSRTDVFVNRNSLLWQSGGYPWGGNA